MVRRTKEEALETRNSILDAAERVFLERGVAQTSLNEIALAAGVTRGAIYWHFKDKADVFNAMLERVTLPLEEAVRQVDDPGQEPLAVIRRNIDAALRSTVDDPQVRRVFEIASLKVEYTEETKAVRERHLSVRRDLHQHVQGGIALATARGQLADRMPAGAAAVALHALVDGLITNWLIDPAAFDLVAVGEQAVDTYLTGLAVRKD